MSAEDDVLAASEEFYASLNRMLAGDAISLADIWSQGEDVTALHPIGDWHVGWDAVWASFQRVAKASTGGRVEASDRLIRVNGDMAYEVGIERAEFSIAGEPLHVDSRFTNIYRREDGAWKVVHHHGDKSQGILEALERAKG